MDFATGFRFMKNHAKLARPLRLGGLWRWLLPLLLVCLFLAVLFWLPWQARQMESNERQEQLIADTLWVEQAVRFELGRNEEAFTGIAADIARDGIASAALQARMEQLRKNSHELLRLAVLDDPVGGFGADPGEVDELLRGGLVDVDLLPGGGFRVVRGRESRRAQDRRDGEDQAAGSSRLHR